MSDIAIGAGVDQRWELFEHGADVGVRGVGRSLAEAYEQGGVALTAVMVDPARVAARETVTVHCSPPTPACCWWTGSTPWSTRWRCGTCCSRHSTSTRIAASWPPPATAAARLAKPVARLEPLICIKG